MDTKTENEWLMLLKSVPDNIFILFFEDNPEKRYVAWDFNDDNYRGTPLITDQAVDTYPEYDNETKNRLTAMRLNNIKI